MTAQYYNIGSSHFTDTGQWKLIVTVAEDGISAVLRNISVKKEPPVVLFNIKWDIDDQKLLSNVEAAVFDNPRILDDFATHIIIKTRKTLWIPSEFTEDDEFDPRLFTCVFPAETEDISADFNDEEVCLYTLVAGLNSFLLRTLPGCKVSSSLSILKSVFEKIEINRIRTGKANPSQTTVYLNIETSNADILAFHNGRFLSGATHQWKSVSDIVYTVLLIAQSYSLDLKDLNLRILASGRNSSKIKNNFSEFIPNINIETLGLPSLTLNDNICLPAAFIAGQKIIKRVKV